MYPGLTDTDCRLADLQHRQIQSEARWRASVEMQPAAGAPMPGSLPPIARLRRSTACVVAITVACLTSVRGGGCKGTTNAATPNGTAS
jgi:hypothetical protein